VPSEPCSPAGPAGPALRLQHLSLRDFRNLARATLTPHPRFTILEGDNGQGKSNVLEAICLVGWQRSFRGARPEEMIRSGAQSAHVEARLAAAPDPEHVVAVDLRPAGRSVRLDGKRPVSPAAYFEVVQMVLFHPGELALVQGGPAERRALLDRVLYQTARAYPSDHRDFRVALKSRNRLLKEKARVDLVRAFDRPLAEAAVRLVEARAAVVEALAPRVQAAFAEISGGELALGVSYRPRTAVRTADEMLEALERSLPRDLARGSTSPGPQGDDVDFRLAGHPAQVFGSQGQQRALVLAIKSAEVDVVQERSGRVPLLLLDDVSSELDATRSGYLFERLRSGGGQVILTTTRAALLPVGRESVTLRVREGVVGS
jgi:DNA replication and repair protein RecF